MSEEHGKRIAVIENEYGEVGIDQALVINADEEIFEMSNGCICCTVRGDLIRVLGNLMKRRDKFDYVLVETTGLADPGPPAAGARACGRRRREGPARVGSFVLASLGMAFLGAASAVPEFNKQK